MSKVSLREVADRAGVSFQTASKVLNGKGAVAPATRQRILDAASELDYVPNLLARSLVTRSTQSIGIITGGLSDVVLAPFLLGAEQEVRGRGYFVLFGNVNPQGNEGERFLRLLIERQVDGIVSAVPELQNDRRFANALRGPTPAVSIHRVPGGGVPIVGEDSAWVGLIATRHLLALGHRRVGTIVGNMDHRVSKERFRGYQQALEEVGVPVDAKLVETGDWSPSGGYHATLRLLEQAPDVTAIWAQNDPMAVGVLRALHQSGRRVPDDCAVVGCDDVDVAAQTLPPLTTVHISFQAMGAAAVRLLFDLIAKPNTGPERMVLPVHLVRRASCGAGTHQRSAKEPDAGSD